MTIRTTGLALCAVLSAAAAEAATFTASGADAAAIQSSVDAFRVALGTLNPNQPVSFVAGRREINWDGVPDTFSDPSAFPGDFFNAAAAGTARGIEFTPTGTSLALQVSANAASGQGIEFDRPEDFSVFSPQRLFRTVGGDTLDVVFFDPSDQVTSAFTQGFGAVFTGLPDRPAATLTFYDEGGAVLETQSVAVADRAGLAFLGVTFDDPNIFRVSIDTGSADVVMDDFIYGEPAPIPLPAGVWLLGTALAGLALARRRT